MRKFKMPEWTKTLPDSTLIGIPDIIKIFGYKEKSSINTLVKGGYIPAPDKRVGRGGRFLRPKLYWRLVTLRNIISNIDDGSSAVTVNRQKDHYDKDEIYCDWYKCPKCGDTYLRSCDNYCGHCGVKLNWEKTEP